MSESVFKVNAGSDLTFAMNWPDGAGGNADLTGYTVTAYGADAAIASFLTVTLTTPATGEITTRIEWDESFSLNEYYEFRIRISLGAEQQTTNLLKVTYE